MDYKKYFEKNGVVYGVSSKFAFGRWSHSGKAFTSVEEAEKWLTTEQHDFRERELVSKSKLISMIGKSAFSELEIIK